jgi:L-fucose mutarotase/ribose pyranase (RbsD/FucU family)
VAPKAMGRPDESLTSNVVFSAKECGFDFIRIEVMLGNVRRVAAFVLQIVPIDQGITQIHICSLSIVLYHNRH